MAQKTTTRFPGVRCRKSTTRKHGIRADECFFIRRRVDGKVVEESCGWLSEGMSAAKAYSLLSEFKENDKKGDGPRTLKELRELNAKRQAQAKQAELEAEHLRKREEITFSELFDAYSAAGSVRKNSKVLATEQGRYTNWLAPAFGNKPAKHITAITLEKLQAEILEAGRSPQTAKHVIDLFRATWRWAQKRKLIIGECPVANMERVKFKNIKERWFTPSELTKLLNWLREEDISTWRFVLCAAHTGARLGELARLTWQHVDFMEHQVNFVHTKTGKPRSVPMTTEVYKMLSDIEQRGPEDTVFLQRNNLPFFNIKKGILKTDTPYYFRKALTALQLNVGYTNNNTKLNFHSLRHSCATTLLRAGIDPRTVQELLGWSTMKMLERYAHVVPAAKRDAMAALSKGYEQRKEMEKVLPFPQKKIAHN